MLGRRVHAIEIATASVVEAISGPLRQTALTTHEALSLLGPDAGSRPRDRCFRSFRFRMHARNECIKQATTR
jgi:hypothetical protein